MEAHEHKEHQERNMGRQTVVKISANYNKNGLLNINQTSMYAELHLPLVKAGGCTFFSGFLGFSQVLGIDTESITPSEKIIGCRDHKVLPLTPSLPSFKD